MLMDQMNLKLCESIMTNEKLGKALNVYGILLTVGNHSGVPCTCEVIST